MNPESSNQNFLPILKQINDGEQNRYGEIEYVLSEDKRLSLLKSLLPAIETQKFEKKEKQTLTSIIYWYLNGTVGEFDTVCTIFLPLYHIDMVRKGFADHLADNMALHHQISNIQNIFRTIQKNAIPAKEWIEDAIICLGKEKAKGDTEAESLLSSLRNFLGYPSNETK